MREPALINSDQWLTTQTWATTVNLIAFSEQPLVTDSADFCETELDNVLKWEQSYDKAQAVRKPAMEGEAADLPLPL
jgi:hypothetical protein